ncbi:MAG: type II toxin-antitoxin system RelE/ParE family toxin [Fusobacteriaceae bacterium]|nr:type II toxin-antitoxin system RelE/ParE family toxin [Fusobacteriaceae bacterium]
MYTVDFYKNISGKSEIRDFLEYLEAESAKDENSRRLKKKYYAYLSELLKRGFSAGMPYIRHIDEKIWELRPLNLRILFFLWENRQLILLHHFFKSTRKTPKKEIDSAKVKMKDFLNRKGGSYGR